jgi:hypothetical protein
VVKKMGIGGDGMQILTPSNDMEYAPAFTPDGLGLVVGRRDGTGQDLGYWRYPLATGTDLKQVAPDGAPGIGSVSLKGDGLTGQMGEPSWAGRAAFTTDGTTMLLVRGSDNVLEIVDMTGATPPVGLAMIGNSRPVYDQVESVFFVTASNDNGATWSYWQVGKDGSTARVGPAAGDLAATAGSTDSLALIDQAPDGKHHLAYLEKPDGSVKELANDSTWIELSPSFSPDGSLIVFARAESVDLKASGGIWVVGVDGTGLANLATDGAYPRWIP